MRLQYILNLKYIKWLSYICARKLQNIREETHQYRYLYYYGFQIIFGAANKALLLLIFSLLFGIIKETILVTVAFVALRIFAGGVHFDSYSLCAYVSVSIILAAGFAAKYISISYGVGIIIFVLSLVAIIIYAPVEHRNRPLCEREKAQFKIISIIVLILLYLVHNNSIMFGILLASLMVLPCAENLTRKIEKGLYKTKKLL